VPAHLLTREAFELYLQRLAPDGVIAAHVSSLHLDLARVLAAHARDLKLHGLIVEDHGNLSEAQWQSVWILLSRDPRLLSEPPVPELLATTARVKAELRENPRAADKLRVRAAPLLDETDDADQGAHWTDDFSNVLSVLQGL
jgi:hypothetical protein